MEEDCIRSTRLQWVGVAILWSGREYEEVAGYVNRENSH